MVVIPGVSGYPSGALGGGADGNVALTRFLGPALATRLCSPRVWRARHQWPKCQA